MATDNLTAAIVALQEAQAKLVQAYTEFAKHNVDDKAHEDIRRAILKLTEGEAIYTREQINQLIADGIGAHIEKDFKIAHEGWDVWEKALTTKLSSFETRMQELNDKLNGITASQGGLQAELQRIENKYAPIIENLAAALQAAEEAGNTELANQYRVTMKATLDQKTNELIEAAQKWQNEHATVIA